MGSPWRTIGVLGGMGPAAGADFFARLVRAVGARRDQDHPPTLIHSATLIPDRTSHLLGEGPDPTPAMIDALRVLEVGGAELIAIPCNSAHAYLDALRNAVEVPVLDMIRLAARSCRERLEPGARIGILAATGTARLGLYTDRLGEEGLEALLPPEEHQEGVMSVVRSVKGGRLPDHDRRLDPVVSGLRDAGAAAVLLACTELPLVVDPGRLPLPVVDATEALVNGAMDAARRGSGAPP